MFLLQSRTTERTREKRDLPIAAIAASMIVSIADAQEAPVRAEIVARLPQSVGNIAITPDNQVIFSHHPFFSPDIRVAKLTSPTTFEPFPNADWNTPRKGTDQYLDNVLGLRSDENGIVWIIDMGFRTGITPKLVGWNTRTDKLERVYYMPEPVTRPGSQPQDIVIDQKNRKFYIADEDIGPGGDGSHAAIVIIDMDRGARGACLTATGRRSPKTCRSRSTATISPCRARTASRRLSRSAATASPWMSGPNGFTSRRSAAGRFTGSGSPI